MSNAPGGPVLITGCSSGIGHASAMALHRAGLAVVASARRVESLADLASRGITTVALDVTDEGSMVQAVADIEVATGPVVTLINNAGYGLYGPVEQVPMAEVRRQFETNLFGAVRLMQLTLPGMRHAGRGRIVNVSSMGGRTTLPGGAFYHASKHALEALSDALRMELAQFGIDVVLIEPGPVKTPWNDVSAASAVETRPDDAAADADAYDAYMGAVGSSFGAVSRGATSRLSSTADDIAAVITKAVTARRPRTRYLINPLAKGFVGLKALLPDRAYDAMLRRQFSLPPARRS